MRHWLALLVLFIAMCLEETEAQPFASNMGGGQPSRETNISNKNVNSIVNMDAKQIASELWKVIKEHLDSSSNTKDGLNTMKEIENIITPVVKHSYRGGVIPVIQIANDLESIIRRLIINENPIIDPIKLETITKKISSDLMTSLQNFSYGVNIKDEDGKQKK